MPIRSILRKRQAPEAAGRRNAPASLRRLLLLPLLFAAACQSNPELGKDPAELSGVLRQGDPDFQWYAKYVTLESQSIKMAKNFAGNRMVIFTGVIENGGEKDLDVVEVELVLFNFDEPIHREVRVPISPTSHYTPPVPPLSSRAFTLYMDEFPPQWQASSAEIAIHGFRFKDQSSKR